MERPSDGNAALPAASGAAVPRWKALLATGIRRLAVWGTGLLAALVALLALAQIVCLALCFLMASYPDECRQFWRMLRETRAEGRGNDS